MRGGHPPSSLLWLVGTLTGLGILLAVASVFLQGGGSSSGISPLALPVFSLQGQRAPQFKAPLLAGDGKTVTPRQFLGKPLLINFWASWCPPCNQEETTLVKAARQYAGRVQFLGVNVTDKDSVEAAQRFDAVYKVGWPTARDMSGSISSMYRVLAIPTTFFVNPDGVVVARVEGPLGADQLAAELNRLIRPTGDG
ncbi:MAG: TlpA disulfide reductase family protein [Firmicutes bacterium]|nr:TlpA disulfide reductase family protein [Bacillota bacterium]